MILYMRPWLARLSFSFFVVGMVLGWEAYRAIQGQLGPLPAWRIALFMIGGAASFAMGFLGVRERHRPRDPD